jgi:hypothetical protein
LQLVLAPLSHVDIVPKSAVMTDSSSFEPSGVSDAPTPEGQDRTVERGMMTDGAPSQYPNHPVPISVDSALPSLVDSPLLPAERSSGGGMFPNRPYVASSTTSTVPSTSVASLIQSAAKLSFHPLAKKEDKLFQDDEYDDFVSSLFVSQKSPNLKSLQKRVLPILPDEQDRKRFIGCLAAVIVSLYKYDDNEKEHKRAAKRNSAKNDNIVVINDPINDMSTSFYEDDEEDNFDYFEDVTEGAQARPPMRSSSKSTLSSSNNNITSSSIGPLGSVFQRSREAAFRAQARHRKRRYEIFCRFLVAATEQLGLEKGHGRCFLPILEQLLVPSPTHAPTDAFMASAKRSSSFRSESFAKSISYDAEFLERQMDEIKDVRPFLEALGPGAGIRCVTMLLLQHLLNAPSGYDARIRQVIKTAGVLVILHDLVLEQKEDEQLLLQKNSVVPHTDVLLYGMELMNENHAMAPELLLYPADLLTLATRKFESLEHCLATKLIEISNAQQQHSSRKQPPVKSGSFTSREMGGSARDKILRGLKIGGTAVAAGTLFAITGGLGTSKLISALFVVLMIFENNSSIFALNFHIWME